MFLAWAADKAGLTQYVGEFAWTPSHAAWFIQQGAWTQRPEPGALVFFDWRGGKSYKGIDHVGVVERVDGKKIHTIEANVDRVWLKRKTRETDKVVGYGVPRLVKAGAEKADEIRSTERPFVSAPRPDPATGSPLDVLGTPPALLAAMVLMTIVLSLRVTGRRRGTHRRLPWPWNAPTGRRAEKRVPRPSRSTSPVRDEGETHEKASVGVAKALACNQAPPRHAPPPKRNQAPSRHAPPPRSPTAPPGAASRPAPEMRPPGTPAPPGASPTTPPEPRPGDAGWAAAPVLPDRRAMR
jgi:hypothetical protein